MSAPACSASLARASRVSTRAPRRRARFDASRRAPTPRGRADAVRTMAADSKHLQRVLVTSRDGLTRELDEDVDSVVIDCDGVVWNGDALIPGAKAAIEALRAKKKRVFFATNNSTKSRAHYAAKFASLGVDVSKYEIYTSAYAAAMYLKQRRFDEIEDGDDAEPRGEHGERVGDARQKKVYVIGERGVMEEMEEWLDPEDDVGAVVVGSDSAFTFAKLAYASLQIQRGALFIATNPDAGDKIGRALYPGAGAIVNAVATACGEQPEIYCGKPSSFMLDLLCEHTNIDMSRTLVVGDRIDTDIAFGKAGKAGLTALVFTGVTDSEQLREKCLLADADESLADALPDRAIGSLAELVGLTFDPDEVCDSVSDVDTDVNIDEDDMLRAFPVSDAPLPEWSQYDDDDDQFDQTQYAPAS